MRKKTSYTESRLAAVAKRENNNKRKYLVVNRLQGKHIPVSPGETLEMFAELAELIEKAYPHEKLLIVGFAETATAVGAAVAVRLDAYYIQTTRENVPGAEYLYFTESHSHAVEQRLVRDELDSVIDKVDRIVFVDDEITTGNTILKIADIITGLYGERVAFSAASLLNGMDTLSSAEYSRRGIATHYLVKTDHSKYTEVAESYAEDGEYIAKNIEKPSVSVNKIVFYGRLDARRLVTGGDYRTACESLWTQLESRPELFPGTSVLVLGTEEFMLPAIYAARRIELCGYRVMTHSVTRSPIAVSKAADYPLHRRFELVSLYDDSRTTYIYDIGKYDSVLIVTDSQSVRDKGINSLVNAVHACGNKHICIISWLSGNDISED